MKTILSSLFVMSLIFGAAAIQPTDALAKAHDNGVGDEGPAQGGRDTGDLSGGVAGGIGDAVNGGDRGEQASGAGTSDDGRSNNAGEKGIGRDNN